MKLRFTSKPLKLWKFAAICSLLTLLLHNIPFLKFVYEHADTSSWERTLIMVTMVVLLLTLNFFAYYLFSFLFRIVGRILVALWLFLSGVCTYFISTYHTLMDASMMGNVFNTRYSEASGFFSPTLVLFVLILGLLPALWSLFQKVNYGTWKQFGKWVGGSLTVAIAFVLININQVLWIGKYDTELGGLVMPWSYTVNTFRLFSMHHDTQKEEIKLPDARFGDDEKSVVVLVIGESARKANFQLYGYDRPTNPRLSELPDLHVFQAQSCATYTTAGTKAILEYKNTSKLYEILPNYLFRTGADVVWRTANWGEPPVHIDEYVGRNELIEQYHWDKGPYDEVLTCGIKERIEQSEKNKVLIVLHTTTNHGPDYQRQYPKEFEVFTPVCARVEDSQKEIDKLVNAYDNSIVYTDNYLRQLVDTLGTMTDWNAAMLYVSDHGESLGENNLFMHGIPMKMAPKEQYEIPLLLWTNNDNHRKVKEIKSTIDQHVVFHTVLNWLSVESEILDQNQSLFE